MATVRRSPLACRRARPRGPGRIFVQIPAYRDSELAPTLADLYAKAHSTDDLRVVVLWQRASHERLPERIRRLPQLEIIEVDHSRSRGCNWARNLLQKEWRGEPYTLLLDSHHRFTRDWDAAARSMYESLKARKVKRPLLTAYLPPYRPEIDPVGRKRTPYKIYPLEWQDGMLLRVTSYPIPFWRRLSAPIPGDFISLHFLFTDGAFNRDVPFDPATYFVGDEVATSIRAYTSGFDLFHPHTVLGWHAYDRSSRVLHWDEHPGWREQNAASLARLRRLFVGRLSGRYGVGRRRSVRTYEEHLQLELMKSGHP